MVFVTSAALAQQPAPAGAPPAAPKPFQAGAPLSATNEAGQVKTMSKNVKVYGSFRFAESCTFDPARNLIVAMNAGNPQMIEPNDGFASLINPDGTRGFHVTSAIEVQGGSSDARWKDDKLSLELTFKEPYGASKLDYPIFGEDSADTFDRIILDQLT